MNSSNHTSAGTRKSSVTGAVLGTRPISFAEGASEHVAEVRVSADCTVVSSIIGKLKYIVDRKRSFFSYILNINIKYKSRNNVYKTNRILKI